MAQLLPLLLTILFLASSLAMAGGTVTINPAADGSGSEQGGGGEVYEAKGVTLAKALEFLSPEKLAKSELKELPTGRFDININGYPIRQQPAFDALAAKIKEQFKVEVSIIEIEKEGYALTVAPDNQLKKSDTEEGLYMTGGPGWVFKAVSIAQVGQFLQQELNVPVQATGPDGVYYTFDLAASVFKPDQLPDALTKTGFALKKEKLKIKVLQARKAE
jgi:hypothetical protein